MQINKEIGPGLVLMAAKASEFRYGNRGAHPVQYRLVYRYHGEMIRCEVSAVSLMTSTFSFRAITPLSHWTRPEGTFAIEALRRKNREEIRLACILAYKEFTNTDDYSYASRRKELLS